MDQQPDGDGGMANQVGGWLERATKTLAKTTDKPFAAWVVVFCGLAVAAWLTDWLWIVSWHSVSKGSLVAAGFAPVGSLFSGLSVAAVAAAFFFQSRTLRAILEQAEWARRDKAEEFARTFASKEMRDARDHAWTARLTFLGASPEERKRLVSSWTGGVDPGDQAAVDFARGNWSTTMIIEYYVWMYTFCKSLPDTDQERRARELAGLYYWQWWRGYIFSLGDEIASEFAKMKRELGDEDEELLPTYFWLDRIEAFDTMVGLGRKKGILNSLDRRALYKATDPS